MSVLAALLCFAVGKGEVVGSGYAPILAQLVYYIAPAIVVVVHRTPSACAWRWFRAPLVTVLLIDTTIVVMAALLAFHADAIGVLAQLLVLVATFCHALSVVALGGRYYLIAQGDQESGLAASPPDTGSDGGKVQRLGPR